MPIPPLHQAFVDRALATFSRDARILGVAAAGSWITGTMDEHSDVDLVLAVRANAVDAVMSERAAVAATLGPLLASFTGEHVGEPRLLICLFGPPLLHVDLKFVRIDDLARRVEDPVILWERDGAISRAIATEPARWPEPDLQWIEDRFWVWIHYGATKIARGELFEAIDMCGFLRANVVGPLAAVSEGQRARGVRHVEHALPGYVATMRATLPSYDADACRVALEACIALYRSLRARLQTPRLEPRSDAEKAATEFLAVCAVSAVGDRLAAT